MSQPTGKRRPYAARACIECQRRKTKCTEDRPCPSCVSREVECKSWDSDADNDAATKRPKLSSGTSQGPSQRTLSMSIVPTDASLSSDDQGLGEVLRKLRRDVDHLSKMNTVQQPLAPSHQLLGWSEFTVQQQPVRNLETDAQTYSVRRFPLEGQDTPSSEQMSSNSYETDTFNSSGVWASPGAIANKIGAIRGTMLSDWFLSDSISVQGHKKFTLTLPPPAQLRRQVDVFLSEFDEFSPFFRNACLRHRISTSLQSLGYGERRTTVDIPYQHCTTMAILCNILWFAETVAASIGTMDPSTGQNWFLQGKRLMEEFEDLVGDSIEVVAYHMLASGSLMEAEKLRQAALHIVRALHTARSIGLNDKNRWKEDPDEIISPRHLLLVLYFQEKRIHCKCGISYLLRPDDVNVDELLPIRGESGIDDTKISILEAMLSYSKLWTDIWPGFMVAKAELAGRWSEVQIADAKVVIKYQELPERLLWDTTKVQEYVASGLTESGVRQKLMAFMWHQSLRLIIRQRRVSNAQADLKRQRSSFSICKDMVAAIAAYVKHFVCMRPIGYFLTCSLVDCVFHLKQDQTEPSTIIEQVEMQELFKETKRVLETLSLTVGCAQRALEALRCVLIMSSDWDFGLELNDSTGMLEPTHTGLPNAFTEGGRSVFACGQETRITEPPDFQL